MLLELRGAGTQTLLAGSTHPSGEVYALERGGEPATVAAALLERAGARSRRPRRWSSTGPRRARAITPASRWPGCSCGADGEERGGGRVRRPRRRGGGRPGAADREKNVATTARRLAEGEEATGATALAELLGEHGRAIVAAVRRWLGLATERAPEKEPAPAAPSPVEEPLPWPTLRPDALHGPVGAVVGALAPHTEADRAGLAVGVLVECGSIIGRGPHAYADGAEHHANEFALLVGETARARKDTGRRRVREITGRIDPGLARRAPPRRLRQRRGADRGRARPARRG